MAPLFSGFGFFSPLHHRLLHVLPLQLCGWSCQPFFSKKTAVSGKDPPSRLGCFYGQKVIYCFRITSSDFPSDENIQNNSVVNGSPGSNKYTTALDWFGEKNFYSNKFKHTINSWHSHAWFTRNASSVLQPVTWGLCEQKSSFSKQ